MQHDSQKLEIQYQIEESVQVKRLLMEAVYINRIEECATVVADAFRKGRKLLICGNGGSAADAQHIATELVSRFERERTALPAIALNGNSSTLTAVGNDYSYDMVFARQVDAFGQKGDVLLAISTSGNSDSVYNAMRHAKSRAMSTIAFLGKGGGQCKSEADLAIVVPSERTSRIQEAHIMIGHIFCSLIEQELFSKNE